MLSDPPIVFLFDVDNTLLDNDRISADLDARLDRDFGAGERQRYRASMRGDAINTATPASNNKEQPT